MSLYYLSGIEAAEVGGEVRLDADESHHLCDVMRARPGATIALTDGRGFVYNGTLLGRESGLARLRIDARRADPGEHAAPRIRLACAVVKGRRFEWALEKAVEAGVHEIVPLATQRGLIRPRDGKQSRWVTLIRAAVKQAHRCFEPPLTPVTPLVDWLAEAGAKARPGTLYWGAASGDAAADRIVPWSELPVRLDRGDAAAAMGENAPPWLTFLVGPEGGWTAEERILLEQSGAVPVRLGPHTLRTETAALAGVMALQALRRTWWDDENAGSVEPAGKGKTHVQE